MEPKSQYCDLADILARKASGRRQRGSLSFAEKLDLLDALKARFEPMVQAREMRKAARLQTDNQRSS
jgi:hypothetical protein